jgi:hypothetical protein
MRLSSLVVAAFLIVPLALFAQHGGGGGGGSSGGGGGHSGGGSSGGSSSSHASSGGGGGHSHGGGSSHAGSSHGSVGSSRAGSAKSPSHSSAHAPYAPAGGKRQPAPTWTQNKGNRAAAASARPEKRGFFSFLRHPFGRPKPKPADPDLRPRVCLDGPCKPTAPKPVEPKLMESDLRHRVCLNGPCAPCAPGEARNKDGACAAVPSNNGQCQSGQFWNGSACAAAPQCQPGEIWNGGACTVNAIQCAGFNSRAAALANEIRGVKAQMQMSCLGNATAQDCDALQQQYDGAVSRYRMLQNEAPIACRALLADPASF